MTKAPVVLVLRCAEHPTYTGKLKPKVKCLACEHLHKANIGALMMHKPYCMVLDDMIPTHLIR